MTKLLDDDPNLYITRPPRPLPIFALPSGLHPVAGYWTIGPNSDIFTACNCGSCLAAAEEGHAGGAGGVLCW